MLAPGTSPLQQRLPVGALLCWAVWLQLWVAVAVVCMALLVLLAPPVVVVGITVSLVEQQHKVMLVDRGQAVHFPVVVGVALVALARLVPRLTPGTAVLA